MPYDFKRLSEVEELAEVPETALALVEVDGAIKRAPIGGGNANIEEMMFDLDVSYTSAGTAYFANMEQVKKAFDNNMTIRAVYTEDPSGNRHARVLCVPHIADTLAFSVQSGGSVYGKVNDSNGAFYLRTHVNPEDYANGVITPTDACIYYSPQYTLVRAYATIF